MAVQDRTPQEWIKQKIANAFEWWINGIRGFVTIPLTLLIMLFIFFPAWQDALTKSYAAVSNIINPKAYLTRDELDVINEWIIVIWSYGEKDEAEKDFNDFVKAYSNFGDKSRISDIHLVRSDSLKNGWMIVIDWGGNRGSKKLSEDGIRILMDQYNKSGSDSLSRMLKNNLGKFFIDAHAHYYDQRQFEYTNGRIINLQNKLLLKK